MPTKLHERMANYIAEHVLHELRNHLTPDANGAVTWDEIELGGAGRKSPLLTPQLIS